MGLAGTVKSFDKKFKFQVEIDGFKSAAFAKCSGLDIEIANVEHREGGSLVPNKSPGLVTFPPITLERGASSDVDFFTWISSVVSTAAAGVGATATGLPDPLYKRNVDIVQLDRDGSELKRWTLFNAYPTKAHFGEWDNSANEVVMETITLEYDFFDKTT